MNVLSTLRDRQKAGKKSIAVLLDPDKIDDTAKILPLINLCNENCVDFFFVGGSLMTMINLAEVVRKIKEHVSIPVVLFPGNIVRAFVDEHES